MDGVVAGARVGVGAGAAVGFSWQLTRSDPDNNKKAPTIAIEAILVLPITTTFPYPTLFGLLNQAC
jgi:hypothetical protein